MLRYFLFAILAWSGFAHSQMNCSDLFQAKVQLESPREWDLDVTNVEVYRRNNSVGLQQQGHLTFSKWLDFEDPTLGTSYIGITAEGSIYHAVSVGTRHLARKLSGKKTFDSFFLSQQGLVVGIDKLGMIQVYNPKVWAKRNGLKATWAMGTGLAAGITTTTLFLARLAGVDIPPPIFATFVTSVVSLQTFLVMANRYQYHNTHPDGFVNTKNEFVGKVELETFLNANLDKLNIDLNHFKAPPVEDVFPRLVDEATQGIE